MIYFATFVTGCQDIVNKRLSTFANAELRVLELHDGLVFFESMLTINQLSELRFLNNVFVLLHDFGVRREPASQILREVKEFPLPELPYGQAFTVKISEANQFVAGPINDALQYIASQTGHMPSAHKPDDEFLLMRRENGRTLWGWRLPRAGFKTRNLEQGELRPELAHILGLVAGLSNKHSVLDPFAGYGGIVRECLQGFHAGEVIAVEQNERLIPHLKSIPHVVALHGDARQLAHMHSRSMDRVITDPPWGDFSGQQEAELRKLYHNALSQMNRVLRLKGAVVMLTSAPFLPELAGECAFDVIKEYPILVSGRKATIYKLRKLS